MPGFIAAAWSGASESTPRINMTRRWRPPKRGVDKFRIGPSSPSRYCDIRYCLEKLIPAIRVLEFDICRDDKKDLAEASVWDEIYALVAKPNTAFVTSPPCNMHSRARLDVGGRGAAAGPKLCVAPWFRMAVSAQGGGCGRCKFHD